MKNGIVSQRETQMMLVEWKVFEFHYQITEENQVDIPPCPVCFGRLYTDATEHLFECMKFIFCWFGLVYLRLLVLSDYFFHVKLIF